VAGSTIGPASARGVLLSALSGAAIVSAGGCGASWSLREPLEGACRIQRTWWLDADRDGLGDPEQPGRFACEPDQAYDATSATDCDDGDPDITWGQRGVSCPADLAPAPAWIVAESTETSERIALRGDAWTASEAAEACARWSRGDGTLASVSPVGVSGFAARWPEPGPAWSGWRWSPADLDASWSAQGGWSGAWIDAQGRDLSLSGLPWCAGSATDPGGLQLGILPDDPRAEAAWGAVLAELRLWVDGGPQPCVRLPTAGAPRAPALACERAAQADTADTGG
jgi:hypothetical protein